MKTDAFHMVNALKNVHLWVLQQLLFQTSKHMFKVMYPNERQNKHSHEETWICEKELKTQLLLLLPLTKMKHLIAMFVINHFKNQAFSKFLTSYLKSIHRGGQKHS